MRDYYSYTRECEGCGVVMTNVTCNTKFCPACALRRKAAQATAPKGARYERRQAKAEAADEAIAEVNRRAAARGLSYGKLVAMERAAKAEAGA